jgi:hypothetical protein
VGISCSTDASHKIVLAQDARAFLLIVRNNSMFSCSSLIPPIVTDVYLHSDHCLATMLMSVQSLPYHHQMLWSMNEINGSYVCEMNKVVLGSRIRTGQCRTRSKIQVSLALIQIIRCRVLSCV